MRLWIFPENHLYAVSSSSSVTALALNRHIYFQRQPSESWNNPAKKWESYLQQWKLLNGRMTLDGAMCAIADTTPVLQ